MGSVFAEEILGVERPEVRLLSIGEEDEKGNQLTLEAHELLRARRSAVRGEHGGPAPARGRRGRRRRRRLHRERRSEDARGDDPERCSTRSARSSARSIRGRLGGLLIRPGARRLRERLDPETYGGGYLLGLNGLVVIAHGSSSRVAVANADPSRRPRSRASGGRAAAGALVVRRVRVGALHDPDGREVRFQAWRLRVRRFSSRSKAR